MKNLVSVLENVVLWMWCVVVGVILGRIWTVVVR